MGLKNMGLGFLFTMRDYASRGMLSLERNFSRLDDTVTGGATRMDTAFKQIGVGLGLMTAGAAAFGGGLALANAAGKFEQGLAAVGAVTRATTGELNMLSEAAINAGIQTQFSPDEAVEGLTSLATAGQTATQATQTLVPVLDLAAGSLGQLGVSQAAEAVVGTLNAYGMAAGEAAQTTDQLLRITQLTNFQTRDFEAGLSKAAAAGATFGQDLNDVLITMGLLRNRNIDASSSATAFREATRRLGADTRAQQSIMKAGVDVFDQQTGKMRSIIDITSDFAKATEEMSDKQRQRLVTVAYGARGMLAFNAIQKAAFTTMQDGIQVTLEGAEAIAAMRKQMQAAEGTAESFREKLLDTFEGQKTLLKGTMQTLALVLGEPFAAVFKPIVEGIVNTLNTLLKLFKAMPKPIKEAFAGFVTATGAVMSMMGAVIALTGAFKLLKIAIRAAGISLGGLKAAMLPILIVIGALSAAIAAFRWAYQRNLGGLADAVDRFKTKTTLAWDAVTQLFRQGGFSGAVKDELAKAENSGIKRFVINIYRTVHRLKKVWGSFKEGVVDVARTLVPPFVELKNALRGYATEIFGLFSDISKKTAGLKLGSLAAFGRFITRPLILIPKFFLARLSWFSRFSTAVLRGFRSMKEYLGPAFDAVRSAVSGLVDNFKNLIGTSDKVSGGFSSTGETLMSVGKVIGKILGGIVTVIGYAISIWVRFVSILVWGARGVKAVWSWIGEGISSLVTAIADKIPVALGIAWRKINLFIEKVRPVFEGVRDWFMQIASSVFNSIKSFFSPISDFFTEIGRGIQKVIDTVIGGLRWLRDKVPSFLMPDSLQTATFSQSPNTNFVQSGEPSAPIVVSAAMPAVSETRQRSAEYLTADKIAEAFSKQRVKGQRNPMTINLQVDGETIARAAHNADEEAAGRSFAPLPIY